MTDIEKLIKLLEHAESFSLEAYGKSPNLSECSLNIQYLRACILQAISNAKALRERLAPEQKPVAWLYSEGLAALKAGKCWTAYGTKQDKDNSIPLYTAPQQREWQGLTDEEIFAISKSIPGETDLGAAKRAFAREIEGKLKEKND